MTIGDELARHNRETAAWEKDRLRHEKLHVGPKGTPRSSCRLCKHATALAEVEAQVAAGKLVRG